MNSKINALSISYQQNKKALWVCVISAFIFGIITHGYMFFNNSISHDSLAEFLLTEGVIKHRYELGRIFVPFYKTYISGVITLPWMSGIISMFLIGFAAFLIVKIFDVKSFLSIVLITGILTINKTTISLFGTFIHDADCDMLAMFCSVLSAYLLLNHPKAYLWGIPPLVISLGLYQSYISVTITLLVMVCILKLADGCEFKNILGVLIKGASMVIISGLIYLVCIKITPILTSIDLVKDTYNSLTTISTMSFKELVYATLYTPIVVIKTIITPFKYNTPVIGVLSALMHSVIIAIACIIIFKRILTNKIKSKEICLIIVLTISLPYAMNISRILAGNMSHDLMHYAIWISYVFALVIVDSKKHASCYLPSKIMMVIPLIIILFFTTRTANQLYVIKDFSNYSNLSLLTRVLDRIDEKEGYTSNETPVAFIGSPDYLIDIEQHTTIPSITGLGKPTSVLGSATSEYYGSYFKNILNAPILRLDKKSTFELMKNRHVYNMPVFPHKKSIEIIDGICVVKMGHYDMKDLVN